MLNARVGNVTHGHSTLDHVMQVEIDVAQTKLAENLEGRQQRLLLVRRRRREHARNGRRRLRLTALHQTAGNSSDFWYAEFTVSGMPQYLNSEWRPTYRRFGIFLPRSTYW